MKMRFISPAPLPSARQAELLTIVGEECAEAAQRASKASRFGLTEVQPGQPDSNLLRLAMEMGEAYGVFTMLLSTLPSSEAAAAIDTWARAAHSKPAKVEQFLQSPPHPKAAQS